MFNFIDNVARRLVRQGLRKALLEGSTFWAVIGAAALVVRLLARPEKPKVRHERLAVGESLIVTHVAPQGRSSRRRADGDA